MDLDKDLPLINVMGFGCRDKFLRDIEWKKYFDKTNRNTDLSDLQDWAKNAQRLMDAIENSSIVCQECLAVLIESYNSTVEYLEKF